MNLWIMVLLNRSRESQLDSQASLRVDAVLKPGFVAAFIQAAHLHILVCLLQCKHLFAELLVHCLDQMCLHRLHVWEKLVLRSHLQIVMRRVIVEAGSAFHFIELVSVLVPKIHLSVFVTVCLKLLI